MLEAHDGRTPLPMPVWRTQVFLCMCLCVGGGAFILLFFQELHICVKGKTWKYVFNRSYFLFQLWEQTRKFEAFDVL